MALTLHEMPGGSQSASTQGQQRTYEIKYRVQEDNPSAVVGPLTVREFVITQLGGMGSYYQWGTEFDTLSFLNGVSVRAVSEDGLTWEATCTYTPEENDDNPFAIPPIVSIDWQPFERLVEKDASGVAIVNSAGDPFLDPITRDDSIPILRVTRNEPTYPFYDVYEYKDSLNIATWNTLPAGTVKASAPKATREYSASSGFYWRVDYEFYIKPEGWDQKLYDAGFNELISGVRHKIYVDSQPTEKPLPLDGNGQELAPALAASGQLVELTFPIYERKDFSFWDITLT